MSDSAGHPQGAVTPVELWCEYAVNPIGIDVCEPRFSWILRSSRRGQVQSAYRILVASSEEALRADVGDKWDSGVVASHASVNVAYAGAALGSGERCYWKVRVWDGPGAASAYSAVATFEMGLLDPGAWNGTPGSAPGSTSRRPCCARNSPSSGRSPGRGSTCAGWDCTSCRSTARASATGCSIPR